MSFQCCSAANALLSHAPPSYSEPSTPFIVQCHSNISVSYVSKESSRGAAPHRVKLTSNGAATKSSAGQASSDASCIIRLTAVDRRLTFGPEPVPPTFEVLMSD